MFGFQIEIFLFYFGYLQSQGRLEKNQNLVLLKITVNLQNLIPF